MRSRLPSLPLAIGLVAAGTTLFSAVDACAQSTSGRVMPRTPAGHPDLQGNWTNATLTPIQRPEGQGRVLTPEQVAAIEGEREAFIEEGYADSDPDREAPAAGGEYTGNALFDAASGGTGGYNYFYIDAGDRVAVYDGEARSSLVVLPENGLIPPLTPQARQRRRAAFARSQQLGEYSNPESRPLGERCVMSFGSNAGPPMLPNYFYNNNYTIVQTPDHIVIMTEMVHDVRIIPLMDGPPPPSDLYPWMGRSWGRWDGDTLVVETTNINPAQLNGYQYQFPGGSANFKVTERFTRADASTINYQFTVEDPDTYTSAWSGEVPFKAMGDLVYEYACQEGNYGLANVLKGARAEEREAAKAKKDPEER